MKQAHLKIIPIIISGGMGKRLWPLSRETMPKPFLKLYNSKSLLQNTVWRCQQLPGMGPPIIVANQGNKFIIESQLNEIEANELMVILEPHSHNTAPSVAAAIEYVRTIHGKDALLLIMPVDHQIDEIDGLARSLDLALASASQHKMVLFGVKPTYPSTHYGYIKTQPAAGKPPLYAVDSFLEKPELALAETYCADGRYYWNSGLYLASLKRLTEDFERYQPALFSACSQAVLSGNLQPKQLELAASFYDLCPSLSFDYAITENAGELSMVELQSNWQDIGSWNSLYEIDRKDENQNVLHGDIMTRDTHNCYVRSENNKLVLMLGLQNCFMIETADAILVANKNHLPDLGPLLQTAKDQNRSQLSTSTTVFKPWGSFTVLESTPNCQVKKLLIKPGQAISLQEHQHRSEHWIILKGKATVTLGLRISTVNPNESIFVPIGMKHRIENHEQVNLEIIEVQIGSYLGEDDIKRYEDLYVRTETSF